MLVLTAPDNRLVTAQLNVITLKTTDDSYVYVDRNTFESAVILNAKYRGRMNDLIALVGEVRHPEAVKKFYNAMPEPIRILAPFLNTVESTDLASDDLEVLVGCLHVLSRAIDFLSILKLPEEVRRTVTFSDHIKVEYGLSWEQFTNECVPYEKIHDVFAHNGTFSKQNTETAAPVTETRSTTTTPKTVTPSAPKAPVPEVEVDTSAYDNCETEEDVNNFLEQLLANAEAAAMGTTATATESKTTTPAAKTPAAMPEAKSGKGLLDDWDF